MAKRLTLDDRLKRLIVQAVGDEDVDFTQLAAYEAVAASTRPISQRATAYHGAQMSQAFLEEMVTHLSDNSVPIQIMHNGSMLPVGKVFAAEVLQADQGHHDLNVLFFVDAQDQYARQIDLGMLDEVSVGAMPEHAYCSECDFDYAEPGNEMNFYFRECDNGHAIGENGAHLRLTGLASWKELSLVNKGASDKPKILGSAKQRLSKESYEQLAASGHGDGIELAYLLCSPSPNDDIGDDMDLKLLSDKVATLSSDKGRLELQLEQEQGKLQAATDQIADLTQKLTDAEAKLAENGDTELTGKVESLEAQLATAEPMLAEFDTQIKAAAVAAGLELADDADAETKLRVLKNAQIKLAAIPRNGVSTPAGEPADEQVQATLAQSRNAAFITP